FFLKGGKNKNGLRDAILYGIAIVVLYTGLGTLVTALFGANALNALASNPWFNLGLAVLLVVFALSFFGYFELQLPNKWVDKTDSVADKGGMIGILAMAATLAIVSFSCTGPLIGVLLVDTVSNVDGSATGIPIEPVVGMFGFSLALALPFALFAAFPSWLNSLPKSGGWMDDIKVSVGFLEIALSLKFLAVFSLIMEHTLGFKLLPYEAFVGIWVAVGLMWAFYWFNWLRFPHTAKLDKLPASRVVFGVLCLGLAGYCMLGFQTTPANTFKPTWVMSGLAPPAGHSYIKPVDCPQGIDCYKDYFLAKDAAKESGKPLFIDFTGYSCENCRKNEEDIWPDENILKMLKEDYVVVSLYVDDRKKLETPYISVLSKKRRTKGSQWADFQIVHMGSNSQPLYATANVDSDIAVILNEPLGGLITDADDLQTFLECGLARHNQIKQGSLLGLK
ncbi:MAG: protein-disulfide reductase DsbD family protein, partial [Saprospiraceae bacterium]